MDLKWSQLKKVLRINEFKKTNIDEALDEFYYSIVHLYRYNFKLFVPLIFVAICFEFYYTERFENTALLPNLLVSFIFFWFFGLRNIVKNSQVCFHQIVVFNTLVISLIWFLI